MKINKKQLRLIIEAIIKEINLNPDKTGGQQFPADSMYSSNMNSRKFPKDFIEDDEDEMLEMSVSGGIGGFSSPSFKLKKSKKK